MNFSICGRIVDVVNQAIFSGEVFVKDGKIEKIVHREVASQEYIIPGFIDSHVHVESSMLLPSEFARLAVVHGTVATVSDPHEIANVLGVSGVEYMIENGKKVPFKFYFGAPSCVPATGYETAGATIDALDIEYLMQKDEIKYLAELMNFPGVLHQDKEVYAKINIAKKYCKPIDGHAPGLMGKTAEQYALAGISTDHECFTKEEALNKINCGMKILIREGSAAKNFEALIGLLDEFPDQVMFCSDDKHPNELMRGHMNEIARRAVAKGVSAMKVLRALSLNPIRHYDLNVGLLQAGDAADFIVVDNLVDFRVLKTCINGKQVALDGKSLINRVNEQVVNNFNCEPISLEDLRLKALSNQIRVIEVFDGQLITGQQEFIFNKQEQELKSDTRADILKLVVVNRYEKAKPAMAFVRNFGLKKGAIASSVAHDSHNIIAVGVSDEEILKAINSVIDEKGGISYADDDLIEVLPLPVAGIMSANAGELVAAAYEKLDDLAKKAGSELSAPYMTLSFLALLVIPNLKLSDKGLFDGREFKFTPLFLE